MPIKTLEQELRYVWLSVSKMYNEEASKYGGSMAIGFALLSLNPKENTPSTSLGPKMGMESTSLSRTLKFMEDENLIKRIPNPDDGRGVLIKLTKRGIEFRNYSKELIIKFNKIIKRKVGKDAVSNFYLVIDEINKVIKNKEIFK
jgi:DNA-binding MarR family transcriptional regulator